MCQLLGMNCNTPTDVTFSFTGFAQRGGRTDHHGDGWGIAFFEGRGVRHFVRWANDAGDQETKSRYYPNLDKSELLGDYIAPVSGHSRGATIDLTLQQCDHPATACRTLDMGTDFDFFDSRAHTDSTQVSAAQRSNRHRLREAMLAAGFRNYPMEWWHYRFEPEPSAEIFYDVPIE